MSSPSPWKRAASGVWDFFAPRYVPGTIAPKTVSAAVSALTVITSCLLFSPQLGMIALLGAMTPYWETGRPLWARIRNSLLISIALTASMSVGVLFGPYRWAIVPVSVLVILIVGVLHHALMVSRGTSPVLIICAAVIGSFFGDDPSIAWPMVGVTAFSSAVSSVLLVIPLAFRPHGPEQRAVDDARRAVSAYEELPTGDGQPHRAARDTAYQAVNTAWITLQSAWPATRNRTHRTLSAELAEVNRSLASTVLQRLGESPATRPPSPDLLPLPGRPTWRFLLSGALHGDSAEWFTTWRMGLAAGIAGLVSQAVGIGHPYWAILTATIVINHGMDRVAATRRAAHRTVGTLLGVGVVWAVSLTHPTPWWTAVVVIICVIGQYLVLPLNYGLALILITPMALLAVEAGGTGGTASSLGFERVTDTLIGAVAAVAVIWGTSMVFPRRMVLSQSARCLAAVTGVEQADRYDDPFSAKQQQARTELQYELLHHMRILDWAVADDPRLTDLAPAEHEITDRGYAALSRAWQARDGQTASQA